MADPGAGPANELDEELGKTRDRRKSLASGVIGAAGGGAGVLAIFHLIKLPDILKNTGPAISMLDGPAIFSVLALFAVFE